VSATELVLVHKHSSVAFYTNVAREVGYMDMKEVIVKRKNGNWGVELKNLLDEIKSFLVMPSKEDAIRYARTCEQRTGAKFSVSN